MTKRSLSIVGLLLAVASGFGWLLARSTALEAQGLGIGGYQLVSETRVTRTQYDYVYRAVLTNPGGALAGATARVTSQAAATTVIEGELTFGPTPAGGTALSQDTFVIRHDRTTALNLGVLAWTITPRAANQPPTAAIAAPGPIFVNQSVALDGRGSSDPEGAALSWQWSLPTRPAGSSAVVVNPAAAQATFLPDRPGTYVVRLQVSDGSLTGPAELTLTTSNTAPQADAGPDQTAAVQTVVTLDGSRSSDADGQPLTYQWSFVERPAGSAAALSTPTAVRPTFLVDRAGSYRIRLVVHDGLVSSAEDHVVVGTSNSPPVASAGADRTVARGATVVLDASGSSDVDGNALTYLWELVGRPAGSTATLSDPTALQPTFVADRRGDFVARLTVSDGQATSQDTVTITTENTRPVANAGVDRTAPLATTVTLDGGGSTDVDGDPLTWQWSLVSRPTGSQAVLANPSTVSPTLVVDTPGEYVAQLIVNDGLVASEPDTVTITTENSRPVAEAGPNQTVVAGAAVLLDGTGSRDADQETLRYAWSLTAVPAGSRAALNDPTLATPTFIADLPGTYIAQLIVDDSRLTSAPDTVTITTTNTAPIAHAGADRTNVAVGAPAQLDGRASSDADGHLLTYRWALISTPAGSLATVWDATLAQPSFTPDVAGSYVAQLIVNDGFVDSAPDTVTIETQPANRPPVAEAGPDVEVVVGSAATVDGTGSSDPDGQTLTYRWRLASAPLGSAASLTGDTTARPSLTPDLPGRYVVELVVNDGTVDSAADTAAIDAVAAAPPAPTITSFAPTSGREGVAVAIGGTHFTAVQQVAFNGVPAPFTVVDATSLSAIVPAGATTGPISVVTAGGSAASTGHFVVTPTQDFQLAVAPAAVVVAVAGTSAYQVTLTGSGDFANLATLSVSGVPGGAGAAFVAPTLTAGQSTQLTIRTNGTTPAGSVPLTVTATAVVNGVQTTRTATVTLQVLSAGATSVAGQLVTIDDVPVANALIMLDTVETRTDAAGNFLLSNVPAGAQRLKINAHVAVAGYPIYHVDLTIVAGQHLALAPFRITPPPPPERFTPIANGTQAQVITDARFPGFELTLPQGVTITGWDGTPKTRIAIERLTPDQLPVPPPPGPTRSLYQIYFGTPMGGIPTARLPVSLPNDQGMQPGQQGEIWWYDAAPVGGPGAWRMAGLGTVSADGTKIVSNAGVGIDRFCGVCGLVCVINRLETLLNRFLNTPIGGDPVDLALGQLIVDKTDLVLPGRMPAVAQRTFNPYDAFGSIAGFELGLGWGWAFSVDVTLLEVNANLRRLVLPGNARFDFVRQANGTFVEPRDSAFAGAVLTSEGGGIHRLRFRDGTSWRFAGTFLAGIAMLVQETDRNGNALTIDRNGQGLIQRIVEPSGRALQFTTVAGRTTQITDPLGRAVRYAYNSARRLETVTDAAGGTTRYTYDSAGRIVTITDAKGIEFLRNEYSPLSGRILRQTEADGSVWLFKYRVIPRVAAAPPAGVLNAGVVEESLESVAAGLTGDLRDPPLATTVVNPRGHATTYAGLNAGVPSSVTDASGQTSRFERDARGRIVRSVDPLNRSTRFEYDAQGNVASVTDPAGHTSRFTYHPTFNLLTRSTDALGHVTTFEYDDRGNLVAITDPEQNARPEGERLSTRLAYDSLGQVISTTDPLGHVTTFTYDEQGNLATVADPLGNTSRLLYDAVSRMTGQVDPRGRTTTLAYDPLNQVTRITDALGGQTAFAYDLNGNLLSVTDANGHATAYEYDRMDRLTRRVDPLTRSETFAYDAGGNLVEATDRKGQTSTFTYDALDRPVRSQFGDGSTTELAYDAVGRLVNANDSADPQRPMTLVYDLLDRLQSETTAQGAIRYEYDAIGRRTQMVTSGAEPVVYAYDRNSRVRQITQSPMAPAGFSYDAASRRTSLTLPNGLTTEYGYDEASRLTSLTYRGAGGALVGNLTYEYDASGNRVGIGGSFARVSLPAPVASATYDAANQQLTFGDAQMSFDLNGNLTTITDASGETRLVWDGRDRLVAMSGPGVDAAFAYDAAGRRAEREVNGRRTQFAYDGIDIIGESTNGVPVRYLRGLFVDETLVRNEDEHYLTDALGSTIALANPFGVIESQYTYEAFGATTATGAPSDNTFQFTGRENDGTGLHFYRARYYSPRLRRFITSDPRGLSEGANTYLYARSSPTQFRDPNGEAVVVAVPIVLAAVGLTMELHWNRNVLNVERSRGESIRDGTIYPPHLSVFHGEGNQKITFDENWFGGGSELVFDSRGQLVRDPALMGTYNVCQQSLCHGVFDVFPYLVLGNTPQDFLSGAGHRWGAAFGSAWDWAGGLVDGVFQAVSPSPATAMPTGSRAPRLGGRAK